MAKLKTAIMGRFLALPFRQQIPLWVFILLVVAIAVPCVCGWGCDLIFRDGNVMAYFSPLMLLTCATIAGIIYWERVSMENGILASFNTSQLIWAIIAFGFVCLAADEFTNLHKVFGQWVHQYFARRGTPVSQRFGDMLVWAYMAIGVLLLIVYGDELLRFRKVAPFVWAGGLLMVGSVIFNLLNPDRSLDPEFLGNRLHATAVVSDMCKIEAEAFLIGALLTVRRLVRQMPGKMSKQ